jgi:hypothetical protein
MHTKKQYAPKYRRLSLESLESRTVPAVFTVSTSIDELDADFSDGDFTLREAIHLANTQAGSDTIVFKPELTGRRCFVSPTLGSLVITSDLTIGGAATRTLLDAYRTRIFEISNSANVLLQNLNLQDGDAYLSNIGGSILVNNGNLKATNLYIYGSKAVEEGGAIAVLNGGRLLLQASTIRNSFSSGQTGGGIYLGTGTQSVISNSTIRNNHSSQQGGGIHVAGTASLSLINSTIAYNRVMDSSATNTGAGIAIDATASVKLENTLVARNDRFNTIEIHDIRGTVTTDSRNNLISSASTSGGLLHGNLGNIVGNAGTGVIPQTQIFSSLDPDQTIVVLHHQSLAIDAGHNASAKDTSGNPLTTDRRGAQRILDSDLNGSAIVDIGSAESQKPSITLAATQTIDYTENGPDTILAPASMIRDEQPTYNSAKIIASFLGFSEFNDSIVVTSNHDIRVRDHSVYYLNNLVGSFTTGVADREFQFNAASGVSLTAINQVLQAIAFRHEGDNPLNTSRLIRLYFRDDTFVKSNILQRTIQIAPVNDAPVIGGVVGNSNYTRNAAAIAVAPNATLYDVDNAHFQYGRLTVRAVEGEHDSNRVFIGGPFVITNNNIRLNGVWIGTVNSGGFGIAPLQVTFNQNATTSVAQQLLRAIRFRTVDATQESQVALSFSLTDGYGGVSSPQIKRINIV